MNKMDLLREIRTMLDHNLSCYSQDVLMNKPKQKYKEEWKMTKEKIKLLNEIINDENNLSKEIDEDEEEME